jgi:hypothetical protein
MEASHPTDVDHGNKSQLRRSWKFLQNAKELNITNTQPATSHHMHITQTGVGGNNHTLSRTLAAGSQEIYPPTIVISLQIQNLIHTEGVSNEDNRRADS